jgi:hypothetical protein
VPCDGTLPSCRRNIFSPSSKSKRLVFDAEDESRIFLQAVAKNAIYCTMSHPRKWYPALLMFGKYVKMDV